MNTNNRNNKKGTEATAIAKEETKMANDAAMEMESIYNENTNIIDTDDWAIDNGLEGERLNDDDVIQGGRWDGLHKLDFSDFYIKNSKGDLMRNPMPEDKNRKMKAAVLSQIRNVANTPCVPVCKKGYPTLYRPFTGATCSLTMDRFSEFCKVPTMDKATEVRDIKTKVDGLIEEADIDNGEQNPALCLFKNGVVNLLELDAPHAVKNEAFMSFIPHEFNAHAEKDETVDKFIRDITLDDAEQTRLIWEMIGACLYGKLEFRTMFLLTGQRACGKSTLQRFIIYLLGIDNVSTLKLEDLGDRFSKADLFGKYAVIGDDIDTRYLKDTSFAKSVIAGETVRGEYKGKDGFSFTNFALPIFSCNGRPTFSDDGNAMSNRVCLIECKADFSKNRDPRMSEKLCTEHAAQYALLKAAKAYRVAHEAGNFSFGDKVAQARKEYEKDLSPLRMFMVETWLSLDSNPNQARIDMLYEGRQTDRELFMAYNQWLLSAGQSQRSEKTFRTELKDVIGAFDRTSNCSHSPVAGMEWKLFKDLVVEPEKAKYIRLKNGAEFIEFLNDFTTAIDQDEAAEGTTIPFQQVAQKQTNESDVPAFCNDDIIEF